jgi:hypothetical protein
MKIGRRAAAYGYPDLEAVAHEMSHGVQVPVGAFSFATGNSGCWKP